MDYVLMFAGGGAVLIGLVVVLVERPALIAYLSLLAALVSIALVALGGW